MLPLPVVFRSLPKDEQINWPIHPTTFAHFVKHDYPSKRKAKRGNFARPGDLWFGTERELATRIEERLLCKWNEEIR